jgi:hypothetical protein
MRVVCVLFCSALVVAAQAQDLDKVAEQTCECMKKKDPSKIEASMLQAEMGLCLIEAAQEQGLDMDFSNADAMRSLGEKVGIKMASICLENLMKFAGQDIGGDRVNEEMVEGTVKSVETGDLVFIVLKETSGRESKFIWLRYFEGSDEFVENPKKLAGKNVVITYAEIEYYVPKAKDYFKQKELKSLKIK